VRALAQKQAQKYFSTKSSKILHVNIAHIQDFLLLLLMLQHLVQHLGHRFIL
jgi:hypothetical protein